MTQTIQAKTPILRDIRTKFNVQIDDIPPWYRGNPEIVERNASLKATMLKAQTKRESQQEAS